MLIIRRRLYIVLGPIASIFFLVNFSAPNSNVWVSNIPSLTLLFLCSLLQKDSPTQSPCIETNNVVEMILRPSVTIHVQWKRNFSENLHLPPSRSGVHRVAKHSLWQSTSVNDWPSIIPLCVSATDWCPSRRPSGAPPASLRPSYVPNVTQAQSRTSVLKFKQNLS